MQANEAPDDFAGLVAMIISDPRQRDRIATFKG
jgi:hypothetical protein